MNLQRFTEKAQEAVSAAKELAIGSQHQELAIEHLLVALAEQQDGVVPRILRLQSVDAVGFARDIRRVLGTRPRISSASQLYLDSKLEAALSAAENERERLHDDYVSTEHLFLGCLEKASGESARVLQAAGLNRDAVYAALAGLRGSQRVTDQNPESKYEALQIGRASCRERV